MAQDKVKINYPLVADEIDRILSHVYGEYLVSGRPTKHGGLRFLDINSAKTFGFERTRSLEHTNQLVISAPYEGDTDAVKARLGQGPFPDQLAFIDIRPSPDAGKEKKMFVEVGYNVPTDKILSYDAILEFSKVYKFYTTSEITRRLLRDSVVPVARAAMDYLIEVIREMSPPPVAKV